MVFLSNERRTIKGMRYLFKVNIVINILQTRIFQEQNNSLDSPWNLAIFIGQNYFLDVFL